MGRESVTVATVTASVSRHNSRQDEEDDALVAELRQRITDLTREEKYRPIMADTW